MLMRSLELLAPAKNLECGIAAIDHGADAVYIGAEHFGARQAAGNSVDDIAQLCSYAHQFGAKIYVTVNTIIYEQELNDTQRLIDQLAQIHVDGILIQDMGLIDICNRAGVEIHASTQCDTRTAEKVNWLYSLGFKRVVLARELSAEEINKIHKNNPDVELEVFVHGALCVSYSGVCYASQHCFKRSANRGECAQFCRLKFDLKDSYGKVIERQRHLLSLKDMCQIDNLETLAEAGACSFKIEGRLKDVTYVKNVVSAYSQRLDQIVKKHPDRYCRASEGTIEYRFEPNLKKTFNRGFTDYFINGRKPNIASFDTPKALGEYVGRVKELRHTSFNVAGTATFANGDGLCFINDEHELEGFRVNRAVGNRLYPLRMPNHLRPGLALYRNNDMAFEKQLAGNTAVRKLAVNMYFSLTDEGFSLTVISGRKKGQASVVFAHQLAKKPQRDNIIKQLSKLGNTPYICDEIKIEEDADRYFLPSSILSDLRREAIDNLLVERAVKDTVTDNLQENKKFCNLVWQPEYKDYPYLYNISNHVAKLFYENQGMSQIGNAFELDAYQNNPLIMQCRHCIRYSLGYCVKRGGEVPSWHEPLRLELSDGRRFRLEFKCSECQMNVYAEN